MRVRDEERGNEREEVSETKEKMNKSESERNTEKIKGGNEPLDQDKTIAPYIGNSIRADPSAT